MTLSDLKRIEANKELYKYLNTLIYYQSDILKRCDPERVKKVKERREIILNELTEFYLDNY
jgi:hypothetical protein